MNPMLIYRGRSNSQPRRSRRVAGLLVVTASLVAVALASPRPSVASNRPLSPPGNVYTCPWIAEHPREAELARVSCDPGNFMKIGRPTFALALDSFAPFDSGSAWVPGPSANEKVGQGVFAWTSYKYTNYWGWYAWVQSSNDYTWYIQKPGNITKAYGRVFDNGFYETPPNFGANNHRWGAQNHANGPRNWAVFWDVQ